MSEWIEWKGGECPVGGDDLVEIELRCGMTCIDSAKNLRWVHFDWPGDITRYRILSASEATKTPRDDGADAEATKTLRDEFAIAALTGILANVGAHQTSFDEIAKSSFRVADAMMSARMRVQKTASDTSQNGEAANA